MDPFELKIRAQIVDKTKQRDDFLSQANQQIAFLNGSINSSSVLIEPLRKAIC